MAQRAGFLQWSRPASGPHEATGECLDVPSKRFGLAPLKLLIMHILTI